jgi:hypothetical protein
MEENKEEGCEDNFPATLDSVPLMMILQCKRRLKERRQMMIPATILGRRCTMRVKIVKMRRRG